MMQQLIHLKTDPKEVVCHVMISECGAQGGFSLSASFLPSLDPKQENKKEQRLVERAGSGEEKPLSWYGT